MAHRHTPAEPVPPLKTCREPAGLLPHRNTKSDGNSSRVAISRPPRLAVEKALVHPLPQAAAEFVILGSIRPNGAPPPASARCASRASIPTSASDPGGRNAHTSQSRTHLAIARRTRLRRSSDHAARRVTGSTGAGRNQLLSAASIAASAADGPCPRILQNTLRTRVTLRRLFRTSARVRGLAIRLGGRPSASWITIRTLSSAATPRDIAECCGIVAMHPRKSDVAACPATFLPQWRSIARDLRSRLGPSVIISAAPDRTAQHSCARRKRSKGRARVPPFPPSGNAATQIGPSQFVERAKREKDRRETHNSCSSISSSQRRPYHSCGHSPSARTRRGLGRRPIPALGCNAGGFGEDSMPGSAASFPPPPPIAQLGAPACCGYWWPSPL